MYMNVVCCGIPRSGSTLCWQILSALFPDREIFKTHPAAWEPDGRTVTFITLRHPYDVAASRYQFRITRSHPPVMEEDDSNALYELLKNRLPEQDLKTILQQTLQEHREYVAGLPGLQAEINQMILHFHALSELRKRDPSHCVILRYGEFWNNHHVIYDAVEEVLGRKVSYKERRVLSARFSPSRNKDRSDYTLHIPRIGIGPGHVSSVNPRPGRWKEIIPEWGWDFVKEQCHDLCLEWDYSTEWPLEDNDGD